MRIAYALPLLAICSVGAAAEPCKEVRSVAGAIRAARKLDGKIICLKGVIPPRLTLNKTASIAVELRPLSFSKGSRRQAIGIIEWGEESSIDRTSYKPESFKLLDAATRDNGGLAKPLTVVLRGQLAYEKHYYKNLSPRLPAGELYDPIRGLAYRVEFVVLEILSADLKE